MSDIRCPHCHEDRRSMLEVRYAPAGTWLFCNVCSFTGPLSVDDELSRLREENARLKALLAERSEMAG